MQILTNSIQFLLCSRDVCLLIQAWQLWKDGTQLDLMDPTLEGSCSKNKVHRCIHLGLLCVQHDSDALIKKKKTWFRCQAYHDNRISNAQQALPQHLVFFLQNEKQPTRSKSLSGSVNGASITERGPIWFDLFSPISSF